ncbi:DegT/DnrJ/EryC1/StrS family aminotransferase [Micromonospora sp. Llam7]|uniref:DegT/DnrJ/EryC1/StrS family aminotransferase n=1 Tax=Micromonospora tarapacensis TaxID=2835305 RepID=UPI001C830928|nr:DegT/DnrJ/EryC1/StrS family aminotransferase [Micromonospora tarapacensis]MBX7266335.1 DegT/DnrJ/EryC1/StrS family aminotransferase [Micromonospora tarapacensis]
MTSTGIAAARAIDHPQEWPVYDDPAVARASALIRAGRTFDYRHGPEIAEIEQLFSGTLDGRNVLAVNSGTSALLAAYYVLGLGPGDEVLVPSLTFLATASPLFVLGATPVLCDSGSATGNVTATALADRITSRTRAIAVTHLFGHPAPMAEITKLARERSLALIEDCSHAHGSTINGVPVGTFGDLAVFSIGGLKLVSGGMGGVLACRDSQHYDLACLLSSFRQRSRLTVRDPALRRLADVGLGGNLRISPVAAVLASSHLRRLDELVAAKARNASALVAALRTHPGIDGPGIAPGHTMGGWYDIVLRVDPQRAGFDRDELVAALKRHGVRAGVPQTAPLHRTSVFTGCRPPTWHAYSPATLRQHFAYAPEDLPVSGRLHDEWISLPGTFFNQPQEELLGAYLRAAERALADLAVPR